MRDLVLAGLYSDAQIAFATRELEGNINRIITAAGHTIISLRSNSIDEFDNLVCHYKPDLIVIDHYGIDYDFEKELKRRHPEIKILSFDDTYKKHYCDILLNHNIYAEAIKYKNLVPEFCELRCGSEFTLIREEFIKEKQKQKTMKFPAEKNTAYNIIVAIGGSDHSSLNLPILSVLELFPNLKINIVTTTANQNIKELKKLIISKNNIKLHVNSKNLAKLISDADFAIVSPSTILNEVFFMEKPFIAVKTAENQNEMYRYLIANNHSVIEQFDPVLLKIECEKIIESLGIKLINFKDMNYREKKMVFHWRNHKDIRKWMFNTEQIELSDHIAFIEALDSSKDKLYFLVKKRNEYIGVFDFTNIDHEDNNVHFGLYSKPGIKGIGKTLIRLVIDYAFKILKSKKIIAQVFEDNIKGQKLYKRNGFREFSKETKNNRNLISLELKNENR